MPSSPSGQIKYRFQPAPNLVPLLPSLVDGNNSQLLDRATSALASVFVGKKFNNDQLANHGMLLYNHAIQMFLRILPRAGIPVQEVLCANLIFQLYEVGTQALPVLKVPIANFVGHQLLIRFRWLDGTHARRQCSSRTTPG